ncbi:MAG: helix-turn-helix domain-containing protein [Clostridia bacterium]|nr:helix-turn-helix domain-containing protein [Clostridia bacterium]
MRITSSEDFGKTIKRRRKALGYTQAYLAEFTGFSTSFISNLENGKETAELGKAIFLMNLLGIDLEARNRGE